MVSRRKPSSDQRRTTHILSRFEKLPLLDRIFDTSVTLKGLDGLLELIGGILLLFISPARLNAIAAFLTQHELSQDPKDFVATHIVSFAHSLSASVSLFLAVYLLSHGIVKIILVVALLKEKLWAYPWMIAFLLVFIVYQVYRIALRVSLGLVVLTMFDAFIVVLTVVEYRKRRAMHAGH